MEAHAALNPGIQARRRPLRHAMLSDEHLARLVSRGDERAFATLYERYHQPLYRYCRSMLRHEADAQDAMQSTFVGAYAALGRSQREAPVRPWLFRIAHNEAISLLRRRRPDVELSEDVGGVAASVEEQGEVRERLALLVADLLELPPRQRGTLLMRELSGLSHEEIALVLETSVGAAKQTIFEARRALLELAEGRAMSCREVCRMISDGDGRVLRGRRVRAHLRNCASCSAFAEAIPARAADLRSLAPPLPAIAAAGLLTRVIGSGSSHLGGGSYAGSAGAAGVASSKTAILALAAKAVAGLAVVSAGTVAVTRAVEHHPASRPSAPITQRATVGHGVSFSARAADTAAGAGSASLTPAGGRPSSASSTGRNRTTDGSSAHGSLAHPSGRSTVPGLLTPAPRRGFGHASGAARGSASGSAARGQQDLAGANGVQQPQQPQQPVPSRSSQGAAGDGSSGQGAGGDGSATQTVPVPLNQPPVVHLPAKPLLVR